VRGGAALDRAEAFREGDAEEVLLLGERQGTGPEVSDALIEAELEREIGNARFEDLCVSEDGEGDCLLQFQWIDGVSWTHGAHSLKFGAEIRRDRYNENGNQNPRGSFTFQSQATGYGFADYMLGYIQADSDIGALAAAQLRATSQAYYVSDNWKVRPNLTIEAGMRYEYTPPWTSRGDNLANVIIPQLMIAPGPGPQPFMARDCAAYGQNNFYYPETPVIRLDQALLPQCNSSFGGTTLVRDDRNDFAPRLGIAWSPTAKWTIRAGAGVFYVQDETNTYFDMARNPIGRTSDVTDITTHNLTWDRPFNTVAGSNKCGVPVPPFICITNPLGFSNETDRRTPYIYEYELNIQARTICHRK